MSKEIINRAYLETLSFNDRSKMADDFGIDVPENLDRRFLIAELLELSEESENTDEEMNISSDQSVQEGVLPKNYNETQISCVLRNPAWLFVFWNISESDALKLKSIDDHQLKLRVCILKSEEDSIPVEAFEIQATTETQEQNVLLPAGIEFAKVELVYVSSAGGKVLAISPIVQIPQGSEMLNDLKKSMSQDFDEVIKLSGINKVLADQYTKHRHSFS